MPRGRSAGSVLLSQVGLGEEELSRCCARGWVIASNVRSGPIPLPLGVGVMLGEMVVLSRGWGFRGMGPALAGKL